jgi:hypothetical protein
VRSAIAKRLAVSGLLAIAMSALFVPASEAAPIPAFSVVGVTGPTNLPPAVSETQRLAIDATGGTFKLSFGGAETAPLSFEASAPEVEAALDGLSTIGGVGGSVSVTGGPGDTGATHPYLAVFGGSLAATDVAQLVADGTALTGGGSTATVSTVKSGGAGEGTLAAYVQNTGGKTALGTITGTITLPPGIVTAKSSAQIAQNNEHAGWNCGAEEGGQSVFTCIDSSLPLPTGTPNAIQVPLSVMRSAGSTQAEIEFSGGGTLKPATYTEPITISSESAPPGIQTFIGGAYNEDGTPATTAGGHLYSASAAIFGTTNKNSLPSGNPHDIVASVPPGFIGNPRAAVRCPLSENANECAEEGEHIIGTAAPVVHFGEAVQHFEPVVDSVAPKGTPAGFRFQVLFPEVKVTGAVRSDSDYGIDFGSHQTPQIIAVFGSFFTFWGTPADSSHDVQRCAFYQIGKGTCQVSNPSLLQPTALVTNPTDCAGEQIHPPTTYLRFDTWENIGDFDTSSFTLPPVSGCDKLKFEGNLSFQPEKSEAATPSAFTANLNVPQEGLLNPEKLATPELKNTKVVLPAGVALNPAAAAGLGACTTQQMGLIGTNFGEPNPIHFNLKPVQCPENSKIGTAEVASPLLDEPLLATMYLAAQDDNPFHTTIGLYLVIEDEQTGIVFKIPGKAETDPVTGQVTSTFPNNPQLPFERLTLHFKGGSLAPLATPDTCGTFTTDTEITPWSYPESGPPSHSLDSFTINSGPNGTPCAQTKADRPFNPTLKAGTTKTQGGSYAPLEVKFSRQDGEQDLKRVAFTLPEGLTGKIAGVSSCSEAQIANAERISGKEEQKNPSCPANSHVGTITASAGIGPHPYFASGDLYLSGPYKGAPLSVVVIAPAVAGPYDLGNVVSRTALNIDRTTAKLTATSDLLPDILKGIPLHLRSIKVNVDRSNFIVNPTSCEKMSLLGQMTGSGGDTVSTADDVFRNTAEPFKAENCSALNFAPKFSARLKGGTKRGDHPSFTAELNYPASTSNANIGYAQVSLPHSEFLDQAHIRTVCTRVQFAAKQCPEGSIYGEAEAVTPLLDQPLKGTVYLRSSEHKLPDLVIALKGPPSQPIEVDLDGRIDSVHGGIRNTFEFVPDAPVSHFTLRVKGGNKGILVNSRDLCKGKPARMSVSFIGQNNKRADSSPVLGNSCKHKRHHKHKRHKKR